MPTLYWRKCDGNVWCSFRDLRLDHHTFENARGVYIIWCGQTTVKVGGGFIKEQIHTDRINPRFAGYTQCQVTWCEVPAHDIDGIKRYLIELLRPEIQDAAPINAPPVQVNFPWP